MRRASSLSLCLLFPSISLFAQPPAVAVQKGAVRTIDWSGLPTAFHQRIDGIAEFISPYAMVMSGPNMVLYDLKRGTSSKPMALRDSIANWPATWKQVSDIVEYDDSTNLIFSDGGYLWFDLPSTSVSEVTPFEGFPVEWKGTVDAAVRWDGDHIWFIKGTMYIDWQLSDDTMSEEDDLRLWPDWPEPWVSVDGACQIDGILYLFRGSEQLAYDIQAQRFLPGFPRAIASR